MIMTIKAKYVNFNGFTVLSINFNIEIPLSTEDKELIVKKMTKEIGSLATFN